MKKKYYIVARKKSKYGLILYCTEVKEGFDDKNLDLDDVYLVTLYYKGSSDCKSGEIREFSTIKDENARVYCFE
jgi:hypothetical protein